MNSDDLKIAYQKYLEVWRRNHQNSAFLQPISFKDFGSAYRIAKVGKQNIERDLCRGKMCSLSLFWLYSADEILGIYHPKEMRKNAAFSAMGIRRLFPPTSPPRNSNP